MRFYDYTQTMKENPTVSNSVNQIMVNNLIYLYIASADCKANKHKLEV